MDINEYLDSLGLPTEDRGTLATILAKAGSKATEPLLRHGDYTKKTQELAAERARLAAESGAMNAQLTKALNDLEQNRITNSTYRARLEKIQDEWGVDVSDVLKGAPSVAPSSAPVAPAIDPGLIQRLEAAERNYAIAPLVTAKLMDAERQYAKLYGNTDNFSAQKLLDYARENRLPITGDPETGGYGAFERLYKVQERQTELLREQITREANEKANADLQKRIDDLQVGNRTGERPGFVQSGSAVLSERFKNVVHQRTSGETGDGKTANDPTQQPRSAAENIRSGGAARFEKAFMERRMAGIPVGGAEKSKAA